MSNHLPPRYLTVHASATYPSMDIGRKEINQWHLDRGWNGIGYHFVIRRDGTVETGRPAHQVGAHVGNANTGNIGICMAGGLKEGYKNKPEDNFTPEQYTALTELLTELHERWPNAQLKGHNDFPGYASRGCPCFNQHVYFSWLKAAWDSSSKPTDWMDNSKYDWHKSSLLAWEVPDNFLDEVDTGGIKE